MPRNLYESVEVMFPILDADLQRRVYDEILSKYLVDTAKARILDRNGLYSRAYQSLNGAGRSGKRFAAQDFFIQVAENGPNGGASRMKSAENGNVSSRTFSRV